VNVEQRIAAGLGILDEARARLVEVREGGCKPGAFRIQAKRVRESLRACSVVLQAPRCEASSCPSVPTVPGPSLEHQGHGD
jgi:hypothetical protein